MPKAFVVGETVAIVRTSDGATVATAQVEKVTDREVRTETPYPQLNRPYEVSRRYWRIDPPHAEWRIPRDRSDRAVYTIRLATEADIATAQARVETRRARERMPRNLRDKADMEQRIEAAEAALRREREPYERLMKQIAEDERLLAAAGEDGVRVTQADATRPA